MRIRLTTSIQKGQALLVVIVVMVVALTIGLSLATRSITDSRLSTEEENSKRAFTAAEAGVQEAMKSNVSSNTSLPDQTLNDNARYTGVSVNPLSGTSFFANNGAIVTQDDGTDIWLIPHNIDNSLNLAAAPFNGWVAVYFGNTGTNCSNPAKEPALEAVLLSGTSISNVTSTHYTYEPCSTRLASNHMDPTPQNGRMLTSVGPWPVNNPQSGAQSVDYYIDIPITNGYLLRVIPLYTNSVLLVQSTVALPSQGSTITSTGVFGTTQRKIVAFQGYPRLPVEFFPNIIFSSQ